MPHPAFEWSQDEKKIEVRIPLAAINHAKPSDVEVEIKEKDVVCVTVCGESVLQRRLHDNVSIDQWVVENGTHLVIDCAKDDAELWPALLRLPLPPNDPRLLSMSELDALLRTEMSRLPKDAALEAEAGNKEVDPDELLDDAFEEIAASDNTAPATTTGDEDAEALTPSQEAAAKHEMDLTDSEFLEFNSIMNQLKEKLADEATTDEERESTKERIEMLEKMIQLSKDVRRLRSKRPTIDTLLEILHIEIWKGRLNHGAATEHEIEAYRDDEERDMNPTQLLQKGLSNLETNNFEDALHYIRLAAIHHNHPVSTCLLQRLYSQMRILAKAAYFVFRRARQDDLEPSTNLIMGEFVDKGMPLFPPYMALAVFFYQRAATVGSTHAMLTLANTFKQGALNASPSSEDARRANADEDRFLAWLQAAEDRGSPRSYFIRASLHLTGECGQQKSAALAKAYLDRVKKTEPAILSKAPGMEARLAQLKAEEELKHSAATAAPAAATATSAPAHPAPAAATRTSAPQSATDSGSSVHRPANTVATVGAAGRLAALEQRSGAGATANMDAGRKQGGMLGAKAGGRGGAQSKWKAFFEKTTKWSVGVYFAYCLLFPVRVIVAPQAFAVMAWFVDMFGTSAMAPQRGMML